MNGRDLFSDCASTISIVGAKGEERTQTKLEPSVGSCSLVTT